MSREKFLDKKLGARIKRLREHLGVDQVAFAAMMGKKAPAVSKWESGETVPRWNTLAKMLELAPMISADWLILDKGAMERAPGKMEHYKAIPKAHPAGGSEAKLVAETGAIYAPDYLDSRLGSIISKVEWIWTRGAQKRRQQLRGAVEEIVDDVVEDGEERG